MKSVFLTAGFLALLVLVSCNKEEPEIVQYGESTFTYGGVTYHYEYLAELAWMLENLAYLPYVAPPSDGSETSPRCYVMGYNGYNITEAKATSSYGDYGVLYNWEAAKALCPPGWRLPTDEDWKKLEKAVGMDDDELNLLNTYRGSDEYTKGFKSMYGWDGWNGDNSYYFNAVPAGHRSTASGNWAGPGYVAVFWTSTGNGTTQALNRRMEAWNYWMRRDSEPRSEGFSVRCVKD